MKCSKCKEGSMGGPVYCGGGTTTYSATMPSVQRSGPCPTGEHLHRICGSCTYRSHEPCADAEEVAARLRSDREASRG